VELLALSQAGVLSVTRLKVRMHSMRALRTIGYEGSTIEDFLDALENANVTILLDIRDVPVSRKRGFSKYMLAEHLAERGIKYRHERALGSPKDLRDELRSTGDYDQFFRAFDRYLSKHADLVRALADELVGNIALLCYERDPTKCHRSAVARELGRIAGKEPKHLYCPT
jgi:uncharacterized protein (DUF488 family)